MGYFIYGRYDGLRENGSCGIIQFLFNVYIGSYYLDGYGRFKLGYLERSWFGVQWFIRIV